MSRHFFIESTIRAFARALSRALASEQLVARRGLLQAFDPRVRVAGDFFAGCGNHRQQAPFRNRVFVRCSRADCLVLQASACKRWLTRVWLIVLGFTGVIALPAILITPGNAVAGFGGLSVTEQGLRTAALLILRVETAVTLTTTLVLCTRWTSYSQVAASGAHAGGGRSPCWR